MLFVQVRCFRQLDVAVAVLAAVVVVATAVVPSAVAAAGGGRLVSELFPPWTQVVCSEDAL